MKAHKNTGWCTLYMYERQGRREGRMPNGGKDKVREVGRDRWRLWRERERGEGEGVAGTKIGRASCRERV